MCLDLRSSEVKVRTAKKDIIVYKRLITSNAPYINPELDGKEFTGVIKGLACKGKISINRRMFLCTDDNYFDGAYVGNKHGYKYSWVFDDRVKSVVVDGKELTTENLCTPYQKFPVEIGNTYTSPLEKEYDEVNRGLHSFSTAKDAKLDGEGLVAECIIPAGSKYYVGTFSGDKSYASDKLTYVSIIKED